MINQNGNITRQLKEDFGLSELTGYPRKVADAILPIVNVNERKTEFSTFSLRTTTGDGSLITASSNKNTYITGVQFSLTKNAACDSASGRSAIVCTSNGQAMSLVSLSIITATAQDKDIFVYFSNPVKIDRGTSILFSVQGVFTAGECIRTGVVYGYYEDITGA